MGVDKRELILNRLFEVLKTVEGFKTYARNRGLLDDDQRPSLVMLDADETAHEKAFERGRVSSSPNLISINPEIYISLEGRKPKNEKVGEDLNALRIKVLKAINSDIPLETLCSVATGGDIQYRGCGTDLARGRNQSGEMGLDIAFVYPFIPSEL